MHCYFLFTIAILYELHSEMNIYLLKIVHYDIRPGLAEFGTYFINFGDA